MASTIGSVRGPLWYLNGAQVCVDTALVIAWTPLSPPLLLRLFSPTTFPVVVYLGWALVLNSTFGSWIQFLFLFAHLLSDVCQSSGSKLELRDPGPSSGSAEQERHGWFLDAVMFIHRNLTISLPSLCARLCVWRQEK